MAAVAPHAPLEEWHDFLHAAAPPGAGANVPVHGDFAAEHVLYEPGDLTLTGAIDWSDAAVADPALDLAGLFHWGGPAFANLALRSYEGATDDGTLHRARFFAACRGAADVAFGIETGRRQYVDGGIRALRMCATSARSPVRTRRARSS